MCSVYRKRSVLKIPWSLMIPWSFATFAVSCYFFLSRLSLLIARMWSEVVKTRLPLTAPISSLLARSKLVYLSSDDTTVFCRPILDLFTVNILRSPTIGGRVFYFTEKRRGKKGSCRKFSIPVNSCPVSFIPHCINIHSDWTARATTA